MSETGAASVPGVSALVVGLGGGSLTATKDVPQVWNLEFGIWNP